MARKSSQPGRSKKSTQSMRAVSRPRTETSPNVTEDQADAELQPEVKSTSSPIVARPASRQGRPYQHRKSSPAARVAAASMFSISKDQEYMFIREDLRRLLITAGILIVVMIGLLFAIGR